MISKTSPPSASSTSMLAKVKLQFLVINAVLLSTLFMSVYNHHAVSNAGKSPCDGSEQNTAAHPDTLPSSVGPVCEQNPYSAALEEPLNVIANRSKAWLDNLPSHHRRAVDDSMKNHNYERFFPFEVMANCKEGSKSCIGGECRQDTSKIVCGDEQLQPGCIVYSIGGNNQWEFELDVLKRTPCDVHTFDCTGDKSRFKVPVHERLHFHHVCLSDKHAEAAKPSTPTKRCPGKTICGETWTLLEMQRNLGHKRIDLFKIDVEGFEWPLFTSWPELIADEERSGDMLLPMQMMVEVHYHTQFPVLRQRRKNQEFKFASDIVEMQAHLLRMGYVVLERDDNRFCKHCTELTLMRTSCPQTGAYSQ